MNSNIQDGLNFLSTLTPRRIANATKVLASYYYSRAVKKPIQWGKPISLSIEPTTSCNLRCPQCPSGLRQFSRNTGMLEYDLFTKVIDELHPTLPYLTLYFQGEPYLNKRFLDFVSYASAKNIYTATSSNAHYINEESAKKTIESGLSRLIISIDGLDQETYKKYRIGGQLEKVIEGTKKLVQLKKELKSKTPHIIWQFIAFKHNEHQIEDFKKLSKEIGVDEFGVKTAQVYDYESGSDLIPENQAYSRYEKSDDQSFSIKNKLLNHCWRLWHSCVITWDGFIVPCCFDKDATHQMGNISKQSFDTIWKNDNYNNFRSLIIQSRNKIDICTNCSEGTKVWT